MNGGGGTDENSAVSDPSYNQKKAEALLGLSGDGNIKPGVPEGDEHSQGGREAKQH